MTRVLSELLGAKEPAFRLALRQLEQASGCPSVDIRISSEINLLMKNKLKELQLDPNDTTGPELYQALLEHIKDDEEYIKGLVTNSLKTDQTMTGIKRLLENNNIPKMTFALKVSVAKRLLKANPPKKAMKLLGYRSVDSMLKHEPVAYILVAAILFETKQWHKTLLNQYKQLLPTDFEVRKIALFAPSSARWIGLSAERIPGIKQNVMCLRELGTVVLLPLPADAPTGSILATILVTLHSINDINATTTYLKLHQVRPDFGIIVANVARSEPVTQANLIGEPLPWKIVQRYFSRNFNNYSADLFEPHVHTDDLIWQPIENTLAKLSDRFDFWKRTSDAGLLDKTGSPVSLNLTDAALNFCNKLPYEKRIVRYFRDQLWQEVMLRYMNQQSLEQLVHNQLSGELAEAVNVT